MKRKPITIEKEITKAKVAGFQLSIRCGSVIATMLVREGWRDLDKLPNEVVTRVTGRRRRKGRK